MADGDPMELQTLHGVPRNQTSNFQSLLVNGPLEIWTDTNAIADGWAYLKAAGQPVPTYSRQAGTRTGGLGSYFQRIDCGTVVTGQVGGLTQTVILRGDPSLDANGHLGSFIEAGIWMKASGTALAKTLTIALLEEDGDGATGSWSYISPLPSLTGAWTYYFLNHTIADADTNQIRFSITPSGTATGTYVWDIDEAAVWMSYTFARNPASPAEGRFEVPFRKFQRTIDGSLYLARPSGQAAKIERTLPFSGVGLTQVQRLRSLWLLDEPLRWLTNEPHLPTYVYCRMVDRRFRFALMRTGWASNLYRGSITLSEI